MVRWCKVLHKMYKWHVCRKQRPKCLNSNSHFSFFLHLAKIILTKFAPKAKKKNNSHFHCLYECANLLVGTKIRLTNQELLGVKYFAWLLLLQFVGFVWICSCGALPAYGSLAEALGVQALRGHPQKDAFLQHFREHLRTLPVRLGIRGREEDDFCPAVKPVRLARGRRWRRGGRGWRRGGGGGGDVASLWTGGGNFLH